MLRDRILYVACFGFGAGVLVRSFVQIDFKAAVSIGFAYIFIILFFSLILKRNWDVVISVFILAFFLGILRFHLADVLPPAVFEEEVSKNISFSALIVDEPARKDSEVKLVVETDGEIEIPATTKTDLKTNAENFGGEVEEEGKPESHANVRTNATALKTGIVVFTKDDQGFHYGDEIEVSGKLQKPSNFMTDQDMEFDYVNYLRKEGIFYTMSNPKIEILSSGHGTMIKRELFLFKERFDAALAKAIPAPESIVMGGIILGERYAFSQSLRQLFTDTGTIHIVTIGGYHVTLVAEWIMKSLEFLPDYAGIGAGTVGIFLYVVATGGAQTSIRAGIMATLALVASATGRRYAVGRALMLAAVVMILINPFVLAYDVSFELSFMATIAIIFLSPLIEPYFEWIPWKWLRDIVAITSSMYIFVLPFILYRMGNLSLVALPANILIVPFLPATMIAGFVTGFAGLVSPGLAVLPGKIAFALLNYEITAISILARLPFAAIAIQNFSLPIILVIYVLFVWIFWKTYGQEVEGEKLKAANEERQSVIPTNAIQQNRVSGPGIQSKITDSGNGILDSRPKGMILLNHLGGNDKKSMSEDELQSYFNLHSSKIRLYILMLPLIITLLTAGFLYYSHFKSNQAAGVRLQKILGAAAATEPRGIFTPDDRTSSSSCKVNGPYPDHACTPGAIFVDATMADTCVAGYTATVRNVSVKTKKQVFEEYGMTYPQAAGTYEVDHFIPLALGGSNDMANLFPEAALPVPGFHEKDVVEVFLQEEVCSGHIALSVAQKQISTDWLAVYNNIPFERIQAIKKKYGETTVE